jgi:cytochrome c
MTYLPLALLALASSLIPGPVQAADVLAGKMGFERQCAICHALRSPEGAVLAGRRARTGPNLFGIVGAQAAGVEGFRYSSALSAAAETGLTWTEPTLTAYLEDPTAYLRQVTGDAKARSRMAWKVTDPDDAANILAFLGTLD